MNLDAHFTAIGVASILARKDAALFAANNHVDNFRHWAARECESEIIGAIDLGNAKHCAWANAFCHDGDQYFRPSYRGESRPAYRSLLIMKCCQQAYEQLRATVTA
jgi:hypothetical protein